MKCFVLKILFLTILIFTVTADAKERSNNDRVNWPLENFAIEATRAQTPPKIDGILTDPCWSLANPYQASLKVLQRKKDFPQRARFAT